MKDARPHYYIDETDCWQILKDNEVGWHAGDGRGPGNETSIGIEIIMDGSGSEADNEAFKRGALLTAILLNKYGLDIDRVVTHKHWKPAKNCPAYIIPRWEEFINEVSKYLFSFDISNECKKYEQEIVDKVNELAKLIHEYFQSTGKE